MKRLNRRFPVFPFPKTQSFSVQALPAKTIMSLFTQFNLKLK